MYSEHVDNSATDIVTNIEQVKIQSILDGSPSLKMIFGSVSPSKSEAPAAALGSEGSKGPDNGDCDEWSS